MVQSGLEQKQNTATWFPGCFCLTAVACSASVSDGTQTNDSTTSWRGKKVTFVRRYKAKNLFHQCRRWKLTLFLPRPKSKNFSKLISPHWNVASVCPALQSAIKFFFFFFWWGFCASFYILSASTFNTWTREHKNEVFADHTLSHKCIHVYSDWHACCTVSSNQQQPRFISNSFQVRSAGRHSCSKTQNIHQHTRVQTLATHRMHAHVRACTCHPRDNKRDLSSPITSHFIHSTLLPVILNVSDRRILLSPKTLSLFHGCLMMFYHALSIMFTIPTHV